MIPTDPKTGQPVAMTFERAVQSLVEHEDFLRSVVAVAERRGKETNWDAFSNAAKSRLTKLHEQFGWKFAIKGGETATAKSFRQTPEN